MTALAQRAAEVRVPSDAGIHPAVRLASLLEAVEDTLAALPADRASSSDALLGLRHQLQGIAAFLRESRGSADVSLLAQRGAERVLEAVSSYAQATEERVAAVGEALAMRTHRDALIVVARMVGMVVGLALLTAIGLHAFYEAVDGIADINDREGLVDAALVPVHWVFRGAAIAAAAGALLALQLGTARRLSRE